MRNLKPGIERLGQQTPWARISLYFSVMVLAPLLGFVGAYFGRGEPAVLGQSLAIIMPLGIFAVTAILWVFSPSHEPRTKTLAVCCVSLIAYWSFATLSAVSDMTARNYLTFFVPLFLLMLMAKPPTAQASERAGIMLCWATLAVALTVEMADRILSPMPDFRWSMWFGPLRSLGIEERWSGPFGHPNIAGPILALCLVFALSRSGWQRIVLSCVSTVLLVLTFSRTAMLAALIGVLLLILMRETPWIKALSRRSRIALGSSVGFIAVGSAILYDRTLDGRVSAYSDYLAIWREHPWLGAGKSGIRDYVASGFVNDFHAHAHNIWIDTLARYGIVGTIFLTIALVSSVVLAASKVSRTAWPLALVVTFLIMGLAETPIDPLYFGVPLAWLMIAVMFANASETGGLLPPLESSKS